MLIWQYVHAVGWNLVVEQVNRESFRDARAQAFSDRKAASQLRQAQQVEAWKPAWIFLSAPGLLH